VLVAAQIVASIAALLHIVFFVFESILWTRPAVFARFGISSARDAETIRPMAYNQGFYNLALAVGVIVGVVLLAGSGGSGGSFVAGKTLVIFGTGCMAVAGCSPRPGAATGERRRCSSCRPPSRSFSRQWYLRRDLHPEDQSRGGCRRGRSAVEWTHTPRVVNGDDQ
jgi:putative membrane protein